MKPINKEKVKENISTGLQLHVKWVRIMFIISIIAVVVIFFYPVKKMVETKKHQRELKHVVDDSTVARVGSIQPAPVGTTMDLMPVEKSVVSAEPIQIQIVQPKEPFDWKGTITWVIGAMNGFVLVILNVKNLKKKP